MQLTLRATTLSQVGGNQCHAILRSLNRRQAYTVGRIKALRESQGALVVRMRSVLILRIFLPFGTVHMLQPLRYLASCMHLAKMIDLSQI